MPTAIPFMGYPSKTAAIIAMSDEGKTPEEIAQIVGHGLGSVKGTISSHRASRERAAMNTSQHDKAARLYPLILMEFAEGIGVDPLVLHRWIMRADMLRHFPPKPGTSPHGAGADQPEDAPPDVPPAGTPTIIPETSNEVEKINTPETAPVMMSSLKPMAMEPAIVGKVYLKDKVTGEYLHFSCERMTTEKSWRWAGEPRHALAVKRKHPIAEALSMVRVNIEPKRTI